MLTQAAFIWF